MQSLQSTLHYLFTLRHTSTLHNWLWGGRGGRWSAERMRLVSCIGLPPADNTSSFPLNCVAGCDRNYIGSGSRWHKFVYHGCDIAQPSYWRYTCISAPSVRTTYYSAGRLNSPSSVLSSFNLRLSDSAIRVLLPSKTGCLRTYVSKISKEKNNV